jgi:transposase-like protein
MIVCPKCGSSDIVPNKIGLMTVFAVLFFAFICTAFAESYWPLWILAVILYAATLLLFIASIVGKFQKTVTQWKCKRCKATFTAQPIDAQNVSH